MSVSASLRGAFRASVLLLVALLPAPPASAADDCGAPVGGVVVCDAANEASSYHDADGITYTTVDLTIQHPGDGTPTEFISSGGAGAFGDLTIFSSGPVLQTLVSDGVAPAGIAAQSDDGAIVIETTGNGTVRTESDSTPGILGASLGSGAAGAVTITAGADVSTTGFLSAGIMGTSAGGTVSVTSQAISTEGGGATGIFANSSGTGADGAITILANGAISTMGNNGHGVDAQSAGGSISVTTRAVTTHSGGAFGIDVRNDGTTADDSVTVVANGAIQTLGIGSSAFGIAVSTRGGSVDVTTQAVSTLGNASTAINVSVGGAGAVTVLVNGAVTTRGMDSGGIRASSSGGPVSVTSQSVTTAGAGADGIIATGVGAVEVTATSVVAPGQSADGVVAVSDTGPVTVELDVAQGGGGVGNGIDGAGIGVTFGSDSTGIASTLTIRAGGSLGALSDIAVGGRVGNETLLLGGHGVGQMSFDEGDDTLRILPGGRYDLRYFADTDGDGVRETTGEALLDLGAGANDLVQVQGGGQFGLGIAAGDDVGRITGAALLENAGVVTLADQDVGGAAPDAGDRLWTDGSYQGSGGELRLDVLLDAGGPGAQVTDRFLVDGDITGTTGVRIYNDLGQGGVTGGGNTAGISVVQVAGNAAPDSFFLAEPIIIGAGQYELVAFDPASSDAGEKDPLLAAGDFWDYRLQSSLFTGVYEYAALMQGPGLLGQAALEGALNRPDAPPAIAAPDQTAALGAGDLQEAVRPTAGGGVATGAWVAAFGQGLDVSAGNGLTFGQDNYGLSAGYDLAGWRGVFGDRDSLVLGAFGTLAEGTVSFNGSASTLDISLYGGGAYAAYGAGGFRVDLVAQALTGEADYRAPVPAVDTNLDVTTLGLGAGASWRFDLGRVFVTPGAEVRYVHAWGEDFQDGSDVTIGLDDTDSLVARGRLKAGMGFDSVAPYLSVGVAREFLGEASATVSGLTFNSSVEGTAFEVGGGITAWALASNLSLTLDGGWRFGDEVEGFTVSGGFKLSW